ncbi:hypothetical protein W03_02550 [Nitrosomonas sp. PY1]|uniref:hypothetical protein n=1 Tax=Nitrosomonas sp. PY1 TaxID=1803906 RepID=UPI001FC88899|nr:hypothetical protein [Nitrosomonas sp. PY1]GKS68251.1 hypothetical protein W03_02550 [Nitrosomonas sp. PY1]
MIALRNISKTAVHFSVYLLSTITLLFACVVNAAAKNIHEIQPQLEPNTVLYQNHQAVEFDISSSKGLIACEEIQQSGIGGTGIDSEEESTIGKYTIELTDRCGGA